MSSTIKLPSGKLIDLSRFIALLPNEQTTEAKYQLSLDGLNQAIALDSKDAEFITQKLSFSLNHNNSDSEAQWDKEAQLRKNQPLMKLIKQWREQKNGQIVTEEERQEYQEIQESLTRNRSTEPLS